MIRPARCCVPLLSAEGKEPLRPLRGSEVQSSKRNYCGGARRAQQWLSGGVNEAEATRFEAIEAEPAFVPLLSPAD